MCDLQLAHFKNNKKNSNYRMGRTYDERKEQIVDKESLLGIDWKGIEAVDSGLDRKSTICKKFNIISRETQTKTRR